MRRPLAVLFDLDGTLVDSKGDIAAACNHALGHVGRAPLAVDVIASFVGDGATMLIARALDRAPDDPLVKEALPLFHAYYEAHAADFTVLTAGAIDALDALSFAQLGLVTNKPRGATIAVLDALGLRDRFAVIRTGSDGALKPDARALVEPLASIGVGASDAWMVGDGAQDVLAGRAAGCVTIGVRGGIQGSAKLEASRPDVTIDSLADLAKMARAID